MAEDTIIVSPNQFSVIVEEQTFSTVVENIQTMAIEAGVQGWPLGDGSQFLKIINALSELDTFDKKVRARQSLELQYIDGGTF